MSHNDVDITSSWKAYKGHACRDSRDALILHYAPLVHYVAGRVAVNLPRTVDRSDLFGSGVFGLIDAIEKFEPARGFRFETYAIARIKGNMVDELRSLDWVPRSVRRKARAIEDACVQLEADLCHPPSDEEVADALDMTLDQLQTALAQVSLVNLVTFDAMVSRSIDGNDVLTVGDTLVDRADGPVDVVEVAEMRRSLADAIDRLSERERQVVSLYYFDGLTLAEIGEVLGVTESRACQIHGKVVLQLRLRMAAAEREPA
ncbi:MAG TPA: FliA/WhiG family RNA polymerase sigma factor [Acidimicrobiales bacterium]|nr:FliA/WhiG family RNA polymerase sigma factor [Acidimicrobiales bacterium]